MTMGLEELIKADNETTERIIRSLLNDENIELKSEIDRPVILTKLSILGAWYENEGITGSQALIDKFIGKYLRYQVSKERKSRIEIKEILAEAMSREKGLGDKLDKPT